jgi:hypothetical protein
VAAPGAGVFPFRDEVAAGNLGSWPIIESGTVPPGTVIVIDAADFVSVGGDAPRFEVSDQPTLHMEDTTPAEQPVKTRAEVCNRARYESIWTNSTEITATVVVQGWLRDPTQPGGEIVNPLRLL